MRLCFLLLCIVALASGKTLSRIRTVPTVSAPRGADWHKEVRTAVHQSEKTALKATKKRDTKRDAEMDSLADASFWKRATWLSGWTPINALGYDAEYYFPVNFLLY